LSLSPFIDEFLRVGGRLKHSTMSEEKKHPILIPRHHVFTRLLIDSEHFKYLHAGSSLLLATLTRKYWIVSARDAIRHRIKKCITCTRHAARTQHQLMGNLPAYQITPVRPFVRCGVDYAGPFTLRAIPSRSKVTFKAYLAIFVCFTTRAIHLKVVSSLSTEAFLATLRRFISRRGRPSDIYSDCGTNFVGAANEIKMLLKNPTTISKITNAMTNDDISWHFNPAGAPHMGGIWEAGVKSVKFHLNRILDTTRLTFEELTTTMCQIEACLNSRPLTPVSTDPSDLAALTPGHFLVGGPLTALPDRDMTEIKTGRLSRWEMVQKMTQHFWRRWSGEYISRMQQRPKWQQKSNNIAIDALVLVKDERLPPFRWKLGRVTNIHPGPDGLVRVVTLKTADGVIQRPLVKLCLLPIDRNSDTEIETIL